MGCLKGYRFVKLNCNGKMSYQVLKHPAGVASCPAADPIAPSATTLSTSEEEEERKVPTTTDTSSRVGIRGIKVRHKKVEHIR